MSGNLFELRKDWSIPPTNNTTTATNPKLPIKIEPQEQDQSTPSATSPKPEECGWGPNYHIGKNAEEDWDSEHQKEIQQTKTNTQTQQRNSFQTQNMRQIQAQDPQHTQDYQVPQNPSAPGHNPLMYWPDMQSKSI